MERISDAWLPFFQCHVSKFKNSTNNGLIQKLSKLLVFIFSYSRDVDFSQMNLCNSETITWLCILLSFEHIEGGFVMKKLNESTQNQKETIM